MRLILPIILGIMLLTLTSANLIITPTPMDINTRINENNTFTLDITNNHSFEILELEFIGLESKGFYFPAIDSIGIGETKQISFNIITTESIHETIESIIEFKFLVDLPEEITTYNLEISNSGFDERYITIREGDKIEWTNKDTIIHRIYSEEFGVISIYPNLTATYTFENKGTFNYYDEDFLEWSFFTGVIEVIDRTEPQKVHNPIYDEIWRINLNSILNPTNISIENSKTNYTIRHNHAEKGLLTLVNTGEEVAEIINLNSNSEWLYFEENNFDIAIGETEWVEYTILPFAFNSNETNKSYTFNITLKASNSEEQSILINLFLPYAEITDGLNTDIDIGMWYLRNYCPIHPCSIFCSPELPECQNNGSETRQGSGTSILNITDQSWYNIKKDISELKNSYTRSDNSLKEQADLLGLTLPELMELLNQSVNLQVENELKEKSRSSTTWGIIIFSFLTLMLILVLLKLNKISDKKSLLEGRFNYKSK